MTVVHTLKKRSAEPESHFKSVLDQVATDPTQDPGACSSLLIPAEALGRQPAQDRASSVSQALLVGGTPLRKCVHLTLAQISPL